MAYRSGTYIAFHAEGTSEPTETDMKYYRLLQAWKENDDILFEFVNSHDKTAAVRDNSKRETLKSRLRERLNNSKNMLLVVGQTTKLDRDWVPFEITYAVDTCKIPIVAAYPGFDAIMVPNALRALWPAALAARIDNDTARVIHVPFKREPIRHAISEFDHNNLPQWSLTHYTRKAYQTWGLVD